jgi:dTMP kinase
MRTKSTFISFEGGEGSGKTTQINRLAAFLTGQGQKVITTREPGGTPEGDKIRDFIVQREGGNWSAAAETLMLFAARTMHVERVIKPAIQQNKIVISDRFTDSTIAYQGYGRGYSLEAIEGINTLILGGLKPDLTIILDIDPQAGLKRSERRLAAESLGINQSEDKFERLDLDFHTKVREGFLDIAQKDPQRCVVIDASAPLDEIAANIERIVSERIA